VSANETEGTKSGARKRGRSKTNANKATSTSQAAEEQGAFVCPECGKSFSRAQALGAHRSRTHGVAGTSRAAGAKRRGAKTGTAGSSRSRRRARSQDGATRQTGGATFDRDQVLAAVFPSGVPPKASVIAALATWLAEGERLSRLR
jgi:hypothetical protein